MIQTLGALPAGLVRAAGHLVSRSGSNAALLVLIYHRVLARPDPLLPDEPDAAAFAAQMDLIRQNFRIMALREAIHRLSHGSLPRRTVCITFDDGYANNHDIALPILTERQIPATVFVAPGFLSGGRMFNDTIIEAIRRAPPELDLTRERLGHHMLPDNGARVRAISSILPALKYLAPQERLSRAAAIAERVGADLPCNLMMTDEQVRRLSRSGVVDVGAHTMSHPILATLDDETARREICQSKARLEEITGTTVTSFAYPNGAPGRDYTARDVALAREAGFEFAVSTAWGAAAAEFDRHQVPRIAPWDRTALRFALRMVRAYGQRSAALA
jgi:peptidoglycan/xylan/chitin deacetylase (PgdA/CDA1 family)